MSEPSSSEAPQQPIGAQAAAQAALEVDAMPMDGEHANGAQPGLDPKAAAILEWEGTLVLGLGLLTQIAASRWKAMETSIEEVRAVAKSWAPVAHEYWPSGLSPAGAAVVTTAIVFGPKILGSIREERAMRRAEREVEPEVVERGTHFVRDEPRAS